MEYNGFAVVIFSKRDPGRIRTVFVYEIEGPALRKYDKLQAAGEIVQMMPCIRLGGA